MTTLPELRILAKNKGIKKYYEMRKPQLIIVLSDKEKIPEILEEMRKKSSCEHGKIKKYCSDCGGSKFCIHKKRRHFCLICSPYICKHGRLEYYCKDCDGKYICQHRTIKHQCKKCLNDKVNEKAKLQDKH